MKNISEQLLEIFISILGIVSSGALLFIISILFIDNTIDEIRFEIRNNSLLKFLLIVLPIVICFIAIYYLHIIKLT
jgi:hypothetical protein